jgi:hypothetical protein
MAEPVAAAMARRLDGCGQDELVFCGPGDSNGVPRGARSRLSVGNHRRVYRLAVARAELPELDPHGPHDPRHTFATWLEDGAVPARVIDLMPCCRETPSARLGGVRRCGLEAISGQRHLLEPCSYRVNQGQIGIGLRSTRTRRTAPPAA